MKLAIGATMHWKEWVITDELTAEEIDVLLKRAGGWVIIDIERDMIYNYVHQRWEPILNTEGLVTRVKEDLKALKTL
jgi:hypothetical protein